MTDRTPERRSLWDQAEDLIRMRKAARADRVAVIRDLRAVYFAVGGWRDVRREIRHRRNRIGRLAPASLRREARNLGRFAAAEMRSGLACGAYAAESARVLRLAARIIEGRTEDLGVWPVPIGGGWAPLVKVETALQRMDQWGEARAFANSQIKLSPGGRTAGIGYSAHEAGRAAGRSIPLGNARGAIVTTQRRIGGPTQ